ncbi:hypothetical protein GTQ40_06360 [Flavobacteriaceae bacterium R38]|nr:hypothetical protein [Flavobacteriaceae bacterium R38]
MKTVDIVILTDSRYVNPINPNQYVQDVLIEDNLVKKALEKEGLIVERRSWDDPSFDWSTAKYLLFRTTWDYFDRFKEFSIWLEKTSKVTWFLNSEALIRWNIDKHYLQDLETKGIHCTPTRFIEKGEQLTLKELHQQTGWAETVLKPCISASGSHTYKLGIDNLERHEKVFKRLIENEAMMLQPFQHNIVTKGEISMMIFGGEFTHAVLKVAKPGDFRVQSDFGGRVQIYLPNKKEIEFAEKVIKACPEFPVYARVDIFEDNNGELTVSELELIEPELWFRLYPEAATKLATYIKKLLSGQALVLMTKSGRQSRPN